MAVTQTINVKVNGAKASKDLNKVSASAKGAATSTASVGTAATSSKLATNRFTAAAVAGMASVRGAVMVAKTAFTTLRGAIIATGIGALVIAVVSLVQMFKRTEEGAGRLRVIFAGLGSIVENLLDVFSDLGTAISLIFSGDFSEAADVAKNAMKKLGDEIVNDYKAARELEKAMNALIITERGLVVERARANKEIAKARLIAEDDALSQEVRIKALKQAGKLEEDIAKQEQDAAIEKLRILEAQAELSQSDAETLDAIAQQQAKLLELETASLSRRKRLATSVITLETEIAAKKLAADKAAEDKEKKADAKRVADDKAEEQRQKNKLAAIEQITQATLSGDELAIHNAKLKYDKLIELATEHGQDTTQLEELKAKEIKAINDKSAAQLKSSQDAAIKATAAADQAVLDNKVQTVQQALSGVAQLLGENTQAGKAIALAQVTIDTYTGATKALAQEGTLGFIGAAGIIATGLANARTITATKVPHSSGDSATPSMPQLTAPAQPASFNIVGQGSLNQLNQSIGDKLNQPVRAYVVGSDVTTNEELNRKKLKTATL
jgi:hypothetical protein